jgi:hypothetical protein
MEFQFERDQVALSIIRPFGGRLCICLAAGVGDEFPNKLIAGRVYGLIWSSGGELRVPSAVAARPEFGAIAQYGAATNAERLNVGLRSF